MLSILWFIFIIPAFILFLKPEDALLRCTDRMPGRISVKTVK